MAQQTYSELVINARQEFDTDDPDTLLDMADTLSNETDKLVVKALAILSRPPKTLQASASND